MARHFRGRLALLLAVFSLCAGVAVPACRRDPDRPPAAPAPAGRTITIALLPERNVFEQKKHYEPLRDYLAAAVGRPVNFKLLDDYQLIFGEIMQHRVDGAFFSSMIGAIAQLRGGVEMLARPVDLSGASTYTCVLFARRDSGITRDPRTWKGRRAVFVSPVTTSGSIYPLSLLRRAGYPDELKRHVGKLTYIGSHDAAIRMVAAGEADFGACKNTVYDTLLHDHPDVADRLAVLDSSPPVPSSALGVHPDLAPELRQALRAALLEMKANEDGQRVLRRFRAQRFVETRMSDYEPVFAMARAAGVDLATWPIHEIHEIH